MKTITIAPNRPLVLALQDPSGEFDFDTGQGRYLTTAGELVTLPRPAVVILNELDPRPGEEIRITKSWSGKYGEPSQWSIELTSRSEMARADAENTSAPLEDLETGNPAPEPVKAVVAPPTPIRRPAKPPKTEPQVQPRLFDGRGTGTHGPAPALEPVTAMPLILPAAARSRIQVGQIPANIAVREILQFINGDPGTANWSDQARQDLASTVYIAAVKNGQVGLWERPQ